MILSPPVKALLYLEIIPCNRIPRSAVFFTEQFSCQDCPNECKGVFPEWLV